MFSEFKRPRSIRGVLDCLGLTSEDGGETVLVKAMKIRLSLSMYKSMESWDDSKVRLRVWQAFLSNVASTTLSVEMEFLNRKWRITPI